FNTRLLFSKRLNIFHLFIFDFYLYPNILAGVDAYPRTRECYLCYFINIYLDLNHFFLLLLEELPTEAVFFAPFIFGSHLLHEWLHEC
ncbi:hypothetical protein ACJX0J_021390, partial [Zea mays]